MRLISKLILAMALAAMPSVHATAQEAAQAAMPRITVTGEGRAAAQPDMAVIRLGVQARAKTARAAMDQTSEVTQTILDRLERFSVASRDVQTSDLSLNPVYESRSSGNPASPEPVGFAASNQLTVRVRQLEQLGAILDAVLDDGANRLGGLQFTLQYPEPVLDRARRAAVADARSRAQTYAEAAGLRLGPVLRIDEAGGSGPMPEMMAMASARMGDVPVASGEAELTARVTVVYGLEGP